MPTATDKFTVTVTFSASAAEHFHFGAEALPYNNGAKYTVIWKLSPGTTSGTTLSQPTAFASNWPNLPPGWVTAAPPAGLPAKGAFNNNGGTSNESFSYKVVVNYNSQPFTSTDPELTLQPPG